MIINIYNFMKHHSSKREEMDMTACCLRAFLNFEGGRLVLQTGFTSITAQQKCSWSSKFSFCSSIWLFCTLYLWKKLSLSPGPKLPQSMWVVKSSSEKFAEGSKEFCFCLSYLVYLISKFIYVLVVIRDCWIGGN